MVSLNTGFQPIGLLLCAAAGLAMAPMAARAETAEELDALSRSTASEKPGLELARRLVAEDDLPGALAALERIITQRPDSREALLLHASLLCRLDDRPGAEVEFAYLRSHGATERQRREAAAPCDPAWKPEAQTPDPAPAAVAPAPETTTQKPSRPRRRPGFGM